MAHAVLKVNQSTIQQMKNTYQSAILPSTPPHAHFAAKISGCTITAYQSGKVVFQGMKLKKKRVDGEIQDLTIKRKKQKPIEACRPF